MVIDASLSDMVHQYSKDSVGDKISLNNRNFKVMLYSIVRRETELKYYSSLRKAIDILKHRYIIY